MMKREDNDMTNWDEYELLWGKPHEALPCEAALVTLFHNVSELMEGKILQDDDLRKSMVTLDMIIKQRGCEDWDPNCPQLTELMDVIIFG
jgi:hypothetical protein